MGDCLMPDTIVWTATGPMPIERIKVGDLVLSQNSDTGDIAIQNSQRRNSEHLNITAI